MKTLNPNSYAENCLKPPKAFFEWIYYHLPTYRWSNKEKEIIASERKHSYVKEKRLVKNSRLTFYDTAIIGIIILSSKTKVEIQTYKVFSRFNEGKQFFETDLLNLEVLTRGEHIKITRSTKDEYRRGTTPITGLSGYYPVRFFEENEWKEKLKKNRDLKYLETNQVYLDNLARFYKYRNEIEYAQKIEADQLVVDIIDNRYEVDMRTVNKNWLQQNKAFFKKTTRNFEHFLMKKELETRGSRFISGIEDYLSLRQIVSIPNGTDLTKLQKYLVKQMASYDYYQDYLNMSEEVGLSSEEINYYPKDLIHAHDKVVDSLNSLTREITKEGFESKAKMLAMLEVTIDNFIFVLPKQAEELVKEGQALKHCVGSSGYIKNHAEGRTTIVFVRKADEPDKSFFTLEYTMIVLSNYKGKGIVNQ
ncbi:PcfJ domain-containing protein [Vagococcus carniphilus]|uniref:PcfJ domain-containing protein n=1 Tax=Vagococcus carniphilus TaxID=218144 RepID=UPI0028928EBC|nr:PcfJ domain-containing protein [Vagococcus carniphilus]MDT2848787.1 PcfJ domain-containing protein [Vagococcus carniphilus]